MLSANPSTILSAADRSPIEWSIAPPQAPIAVRGSYGSP
jgi:hypothetical protein